MSTKFLKISKKVYESLTKSGSTDQPVKTDKDLFNLSFHIMAIRRSKLYKNSERLNNKKVEKYNN